MYIHVCTITPTTSIYSHTCSMYVMYACTLACTRAHTSFEFTQNDTPNRAACSRSASWIQNALLHCRDDTF